MTIKGTLKYVISQKRKINAIVSIEKNKEEYQKGEK